MSNQPTGTVSERFMAMIRPKRRTDRVTEDDQFLAMMWRMVRALEARTVERPENLSQVLALVQRFGEIVNVAISVNADRYAIDPKLGASMKECARILGISAPSASERRARGAQIIADRLAAAGAVSFSEAKRERAAIQAAEEHAVTVLADYRARHRAA